MTGNILCEYWREQAGTLLTSVETQALVACFTGNREHSTQIEQATAAAILQRIHGRRWLACGCRPGVEPPPLMGARRHDTGALHINRFGATAHDPGCPFYVEMDERTSPAIAGGGPLKAITGSWLLATPRGRGVSTGTGGKPVGNRSWKPRMPRLGRLLMTILEAAGINRIEPTDVELAPTEAGRPARVRYARLLYDRLKTLDSYELDTRKAPGLTWRDLTCTYLGGLTRHCIQIRKLIPKFRMPEDAQGLFVGVVDGVRREPEGHWVLVRKSKGNGPTATVRILGEPKTSGQKAGAGIGPFWAIAQLASDPTTSRIEPTEAYLHPCYSKAFPVPVDSDLERRTLRLALEQVVYWQSKGVGVHVVKPVLDELTEDEAACRPDFELRLPGGPRFLIETMGYEDDDYMQCKVGTHARMRRLPGVAGLFEHWAGSEEAEGRDRLRRLLTVAVLGASGRYLADVEDDCCTSGDLKGKTEREGEI
ncbi:DUF1173 domain-containing protein [Marilutibacter chinensis]|uniref:DUF1173 domain-containing protein n=1 Tax=Marilutibacter chinensis TaxID=2912247 RepID=A0ABS9HRN2_9GAMM|nr:DUF1173 domain-containing protein [Lysobacter chinensis]MCF7221604.1 DUF1173 domain-containing protein [Lysobacter chinensis]